MDWFLYYDLAQEWVEHDGEAHKPSAVSRAYYALICTALDELVDNVDEYNPPECGSEHLNVWNSYKEDRHPRGTRQIGVLGNRLRRSRNKADYDNDIDDFLDVVEVAMIDARELKDQLEALRV